MGLRPNYKYWNFFSAVIDFRRWNLTSIFYRLPILYVLDAIRVRFWCLWLMSIPALKGLPQYRVNVSCFLGMGSSLCIPRGYHWKNCSFCVASRAGWAANQIHVVCMTTTACSGLHRSTDCGHRRKDTKPKILLQCCFSLLISEFSTFVFGSPHSAFLCKNCSRDYRRILTKSSRQSIGCSWQWWQCTRQFWWDLSC